nr:protein FAR1-RELATED SEQUENCE 5-like [Setaria viridis]
MDEPAQLHSSIVASMDEPVACMEDIRGQEDGMTTVDRMTFSSLLEDSRALEFDAVGDGGREDEQITQNNMVTRGVENIGTILQTSGSIENEVPEEVVRKGGQNFITPTVGMTFESEDQAYEMYNTYAGKVGFSIRKSKTKHRRDGSLCQKFIVCSNQGHRENEVSQEDITRTGCDARVQFSISKEGI